MAKQAAKLCLLGATDADLADFFEVSVRTIERWQSQHAEFCRAVKVAKEEANDRVERSLYQKAVGFQREAVKIFMPAGSEEPVYAPYIENVHPDTAAAIFWLKNRRKDEWRDKQDVDHNHKVTISEEFEAFIRRLNAPQTAPRRLEAQTIDADFDQAHD